MLGRADPRDGPDAPANFFLSAAVDADDRVLALGQTAAWISQIDAAKTAPHGIETLGVQAGAVTRRSKSHDPEWYAREVPPPDTSQVEADLKNLPANEWMLRPTPKRPGMNMDWGSAVFAPELDLIVRFSGGHSAYSGTAPVVYDVKTDRYSLPFAPEYPLEYIYSNDQVHGEWSFKRNPWMTGHTYKSTGYDPRLKSLVFAPHEYTYFFDPKTSRWSHGPDGMAYDSQRDRLLLFSDLGQNKGDVLEYDLRTGTTRWLQAAGREQALAQSRETIYISEADAVLVGAHVPGDHRWPMYACAANAWLGIELKGADPVGKKAFNNSMGLQYDPNRRLIWAVAPTKKRPGRVTGAFPQGRKPPC